MQAKRIGKERLEYQAVNTPQCQGEIVGPQPSYRKAGGKQCWRKSQYELDGKPYCAFHAGRIALAMLLKQPAEQAALPSTLEDLGEPGRKRPLKETR